MSNIKGEKQIYYKINKLAVFFGIKYFFAVLCRFCWAPNILILLVYKMNPDIEKLFSIAYKQERLIIGLMSGTSMDGLDIALCSCRGFGASTRVKVLKFKTAGYTDDFRKQVKSIFSRRDADLQQVCLLNEQIGLVHAGLVLEALDEWQITASEVDLIASHGQTIFHAPQSLHHIDSLPNGTLQIGDGDHIAAKTKIITVADFRQKHLAAGGEGAPLAVYGDYLLFSQKGKDRIMLNIGGIANFTFLSGSLDASRVFSTDVGPGNTLMDQYIQLHYPGRYFDQDGALAASGKASEALLQALLDEDFFAATFPKTTGPELFNLDYLSRAQDISGTLRLSRQDVLATLAQFSAQAIVDAVERCSGPENAPEIFMSGGGMHNPVLVNYLREKLPYARFSTTAELGIDPDAKEAVLFAVLANECVAGRPVQFAQDQGVPAVCMGKICLPN